MFLCVQAIAAKVDGYNAADLRVLLDRAALAAARRGLAEASRAPHSRAAQQSPALVAAGWPADGVSRASPPEQMRQLRITGADLSTALQGFTPSAYWGVGKLSSSGPGVQVCALLFSSEHVPIVLEAPEWFSSLRPLGEPVGPSIYRGPTCKRQV